MGPDKKVPPEQEAEQVRLPARDWTPALRGDPWLPLPGRWRGAVKVGQDAPQGRGREGESRAR